MSCILRPQTYDGSRDKPLPRETWCTRGNPLEWCLTSLDHAAQNGLNGGDGLHICTDCVDAAIEALTY